jgi:uncharacterized protein YydD (DUF2326 family)
MFLKSLKISTNTELIREITFKKGMNLIIDESEGDVTGNNIGKTTVLKLVDFCFGAKRKIIYEDPESNKEINKPVKDFLIEKEVLITLILTPNLDDETVEVVTIERNFLARNKHIRRINGFQYTEDKFESKLTSIFFPEHVAAKPSFRNIISHNIRYKDLSVTQTLKTLDKYTYDAEYETLYLYLLGCDFTSGDKKQEILQKVKQEDTFKRRLEKKQTKSAYEATLSLVDSEIEVLKKKKETLNINENFEADLDLLSQYKYQINRKSSEVSKLNIRRDLINEATQDLSSNKSDIDLHQLQLIYQQATDKIGEIQKTFQDLVQFHNQMLTEKAKFLTKELPLLEKKIVIKKTELNTLLRKEIELSKRVSKSHSFEELEELIDELNTKHKTKGEYESIIQQLKEVEENLKTYNKQLKSIDDEIFSEDFETIVKAQLVKFNKHFSDVSDILYNEKYLLKYDKITNRKGQRLYKFSAFNANFSSGKKQGEISCFDIAYTLFADEENIPCMHFLLNDKKELMHDNQLVKIKNLVIKNEIQFIASILRDKLPQELDNDKFFILKLSEQDKLFRIEK